MEELGYPPGIYQSIFYTALFIHPSHIWAGFYYEMTSCALMGVALWATSLNYWRHPVIRSRRRTIDMIVAKSSIAYHLYLSLHTTNRVLTTLPILTGSGLYVASFYLYEKKYVKSAAVCHCLLHALVSIGASMTYIDYHSQDTCANAFKDILLQMNNPITASTTVTLKCCT
jgi:hypothetical protein